MNRSLAYATIIALIVLFILGCIVCMAAAAWGNWEYQVNVWYHHSIQGIGRYFHVQ